MDRVEPEAQASDIEDRRADDHADPNLELATDQRSQHRARQLRKTRPHQSLPVQTTPVAAAMTPM